MRRSGKHDNVFSDLVGTSESFLPDESAESARAVAIDLRDRLAKLEQQMLSQYSAMAAYATIAQQSVETARAESRHDLDRSQATMIGLMERVRREVTDSISGLRARLDGMPDDDGDGSLGTGTSGDGPGAAAGAAGLGGGAGAPGAAGARGGAGAAGGNRVGALERRVESLERTLAEVLETQRQLVDTVAELTRDKMEREGWLVSDGSPEDLTLR